MPRPDTHRQLFELLRQCNLSELIVPRDALGLSDAVSRDVEADLLARAARSWQQPGR